MDHKNLENSTSSAPMLPRNEKVVILTPSNGGGKLLIREDTILANLQGCASCGRAQFACSGMKDQWSALCWGKNWEKRYYCLLSVLTTTFVISLIGTIFFCFTNTINNAILSNMVLRNNSMAFKMWQSPSVKPLMKVHLFNYTNWDRVKSGLDEKLKVQDVGPYVYSQSVERVNINFEGDTITFQEKNKYKFLRGKSTGEISDRVIVPNLPLLGVISKAVNMGVLYPLSSMIDSAVQSTKHPEPFLKLPVHNFLWGYEDTIINTAKPLLSLQGQLKFSNFGLLASKNGTVDDVITIHTGENDMKKMNLIQKLNGEEHLTYWSSPECNSIEASDGSIFPPSLLEDKTQPLKVFYSNICRKLPFYYQKDVEGFDGIQLKRYKMPLNVFEDSEHNPDNGCYCDVRMSTCPPRGVIDVSACAMGAPAYVSFPHFHSGDVKLQEAIDGLSPNSSLHESFLDVHPTLGITLNGKSSLQINMQVKKTSAYSSLRALPDGLILPIAWLEQSVEELPEDIRSLIYHGTYSSAAAQFTLVVFSIIGLFLSSLGLLVLYFKRKHRPCAVLQVTVKTDCKVDDGVM